MRAVVIFLSAKLCYAMLTYRGMICAAGTAIPTVRILEPRATPEKRVTCVANIVWEGDHDLKRPYS